MPNSNNMEQIAFTDPFWKIKSTFTGDLKRLSYSYATTSSTPISTESYQMQTNAITNAHITDTVKTTAIVSYNNNNGLVGGAPVAH